MHLSKPAALFFMHVYVHAYLYGVHPYASIMAAWGRNDVQNHAQYKLVFVCVCVSFIYFTFFSFRFCVKKSLQL